MRPQRVATSILGAATFFALLATWPSQAPAADLYLSGDLVMSGAGAERGPFLRCTSSKETACGCAGCYTAYAGIELYAEAFANAVALEQLEGFASRFGPAFYGLPVNEARMTLVAEFRDAATGRVIARLADLEDQTGSEQALVVGQVAHVVRQFPAD